MKINDKQLLQSNEKRLTQQIVNMNKAKERELGQLKHILEKEKTNVKLDGEAQLNELRVKNQDSYADLTRHEHEKLENTLKGYRDYNKLLLSEKEKLKEIHEHELKNITSNASEKFQVKMNQDKDFALDLRDKTKRIKEQALSDSRRKIIDSNQQTSLAVSNKHREHDKKIRDTNFKLKVERDKQKIEHASVKAKDRILRQTELRKLRKEFKMRSTHEKTNQQAQLRKMRDQHGTILKNEKTSFNQKLKSMKMQHEKVINRIKKVFDKEVQNLTSSNSSIKNLIRDRSDDPFYQVPKLTPEFVELPNHYLVKLKVPPFEKDNVNINAQDRNIELKLSRRFVNSFYNDDGTNAGVSKSEIYSESFNVKNLLDPHFLEKRYDDETMMLEFKLKKA